MKSWNSLRQITDDGKLTSPHAVELGRINFKVHDPSIRSKARRISGHAIVKPGAEYQQQVGFVQRHVCRPRTMHSDHSQVIRRLGRNRS